MGVPPLAILIAPRGATGALAVLVDRLTGAGVRVDVVDDAGGAADLARFATGLPCVLVDLREVSAGDPEDLRVATEALRRAAEAVPHALPIAITGEANPSLLVACMRAGAGDIIDLRLEGTASARNVLARVAQLQAERVAARALHDMIEDLLKDLIRTERRSIDLEVRLEARNSSGELPSYGETRPPAVLLVDPERAVTDELAEQLEAQGIASYAFVTGEDALHDADDLLDLALVAAQLPGMDGLETARRLRERISGLQVFLITAVHDADLAAAAADLGVVGFVHKPLAIAEVVPRVAQLAREALQRTRERLYLERIKARHERVLARYRSLPRPQ